jgi:hypothetical protein
VCTQISTEAESVNSLLFGYAMNQLIVRFAIFFAAAGDVRVAVLSPFAGFVAVVVATLVVGWVVVGVVYAALSWIFLLFLDEDSSVPNSPVILLPKCNLPIY